MRSPWKKAIQLEGMFDTRNNTLGRTPSEIQSKILKFLALTESYMYIISLYNVTRVFKTACLSILSDFRDTFPKIFFCVIW